MGDGILAIGALGLLGAIFYIVFLLFLLIAPVIIWRNTNQTNRLLLLFLIKEGVPKDIIDNFFYNKKFGNDDKMVDRMVEYIKSRKKQSSQ